MYNPLHYQSSSGPADHANTINLFVSSPSSNPLSWDQIIDAKNANASHLRKVGGGVENRTVLDLSDYEVVIYHY